jgi:UPF0042 nucleotide-binding protein
MKLVIVSGRSGSGKSAALNVLEDLGYYCIDNLPAGLLTGLVEQALQGKESKLGKIAISIDARNLASEIENFSTILDQIKHIDKDIIYLDAHSDTLLRRFSATRRKHPLSTSEMSLKEAIKAEKKTLVSDSTQSRSQNRYQQFDHLPAQRSDQGSGRRSEYAGNSVAFPILRLQARRAH